MALLLDTCILIGGTEQITEPAAVSVISMLELKSGLGAAADPVERARRQERYDRVASALDPLPVDSAVLAPYGRIDAAVRARQRRPRGRLADLLIAGTAAAHGATLLTDDVAGGELLRDLTCEAQRQPALDVEVGQLVELLVRGVLELGALDAQQRVLAVALGPHAGELTAAHGQRAGDEAGEAGEGAPCGWDAWRPRRRRARRCW